MKKLFLMLSVFVFLTVNFLGCASTPTGVPDVDDLEDAPSWVLEGGSSDDDEASAVGSAKVGKAGMNFARTEAMAYARDELARQLGLKVKNMVKNFAQTTGLGDKETVDKVSSQVSKQVTNETLSGSKQKDMWISPGSDLYMLVAIDGDSLRSSVKDSVRTSLKNEEALWQQFQAKKANEELDREIEKEFGEFKSQ